MEKDLLIIFAKNPVLGKVKTRLAATMGEEKALAIYHILLTHTVTITSELKCDKVVFYSDFIDYEDKWDNSFYQKRIQTGQDLGQRMSNAFEWAFNQKYSKVCIIGTDCIEIDPNIIEKAFIQLIENDAVIGPAHDGGYYLLGLKSISPNLFKNKAWSTSVVLSETIKEFQKQKLAYHCTPVLNDIDTEEDWQNFKDSK